MPRPTEPAVSGTFIHPDGTLHHFRVTADTAIQWGADTEHLGRTVDTLQAVRRAALEEGFLTPDPEQEDPQ